MRALSRLLGVTTTPLSTPDPTPLQQVSFTAEARRTLGVQLHHRGRVRGGLLFGEARAGTLHVTVVTPPALPHWGGTLLEPDERYVLGWSDAMYTLYRGQVDWVGHWVARADSTLPTLEEDLAWFEQGAASGLFDEQHVLVTAGWADGVLTGRASVMFGGAWGVLPVHL
ncbi:hypothetical protein [Deinococcus radiotolerans]|uniref:Uncharacterized protein n=1 Tax=Deinococcus radiotolerans TaxID=1309407 RepID=A0ABQ2FNE9_9DEIO|nr:hypothetical protein [Deinococcus radiotolerans]GGL11265.1 hypothetical protein GCM10010844_32420 [Deinococcus radiotolerans]